MLRQVDVGERSLASYRGIAPDGLLEDLLRVAEGLRGARVLHINATPYGGGVSELLRSLVPLLNDLGLRAEWRILGGDPNFFRVTKSIHNGLQGMPVSLSPADRELYLEVNRENARFLEDDYDFIVVHDPQPAGLLAARGRGRSRWIWRCHLDTSSPDPEVWAFLQPLLEGYDAAIFTMREFVPPDFPLPRVEIIPPAIDPLSPKNLPLPDRLARQVLDWIGVRLHRPLVTQVARFDPWKDPLGVLHAYRLAREEVPGLQLALVGQMALDDPEGWEVYEQVRTAARDDPRVHIFTNLTGVGNIEVNAFQRLSDVVVQKSVREGFGLVVSETLWKGTPMVAGRAGGIRLQMADGVGGFLIDTAEECARAIVRLVKDPDLAREMARRGRERVRHHFLLPRLVLNELLVMDRLAHPRQGRPPVLQDPACGMALDASAPLVPCAQTGDCFCSAWCRDRYIGGTRVEGSEGGDPL